MASNRKFHRYVFRYEVLSEDPMDYEPSLSDLQHLTYDGPCSGRMLEPEHAVLNGKQAADALIEQASEPGFFQLDAEGNDVES